MTDQASIFENEEVSTPPSVETKENVSNTIPEYLQELVGEGKKYRTLDDAMRSLPFAMKHIQTLEGENESLRKAVETKDSVQEMLKSLSASPSNEKTSPALSKDDIGRMVAEALRSHDNQKQQLENIRSVDKKMRDLYGEEAVALVKKRAEDLGVSVPFLQSTAANSPAAFLSIMGISKEEAHAASGGNMSFKTALNNKADSTLPGKGAPAPNTYAYYTKLRKENPELYNSRKVQLEMQNAAIEASRQGRNFYEE